MADLSRPESHPTETAAYRLYQDLAEWWPLISPPGEYEEEAAFAAQVLARAADPVQDVLELGSGGGSNASYLKARFTLTLVDASASMLAVSRRLNPDCAHAQGDMRTIRLGRTFDAVFVHDAVDYMTTEADLGQVMATAYAHCRPGGVAVFVPDCLAETFTADTGCGGGDGDDGRGARFLQWSYDPDPDDTWTLTDYVYLLRDRSGPVQVVHETHRLGLFGRQAWLRLLAGAGFEARAIKEETTEDRPPREFFLGRRPAGNATDRSSA
ncbi:MAG TPA: class I SAM-dependent methyltransferase [Streptosporangiaceae bacterium]|jgi:trans-aconitate methyltransferase